MNFRLASGLSRSNRTRPMSAHETRHGNESIFAMRQRHWEGLIQGKKSLHRGQLLPGSSTSDEDPNNGKKSASCKVIYEIQKTIKLVYKYGNFLFLQNRRYPSSKTKRKRDESSSDLLVRGVVAPKTG